MPPEVPRNDREHFLEKLSSRRFIRRSASAASRLSDELATAREEFLNTVKNEYWWPEDLEKLWGSAKEILKNDPSFAHEIMQTVRGDVGDIVDPLLLTAHQAAQEVEDPELAQKILEHAHSAIESRVLSELKAWEKAKSEGSLAESSRRLTRLLSFSKSTRFHEVLQRSTAVKEFLSKHPELIDDLRKEAGSLNMWHKYDQFAARIVAAYPDLVEKLGENPKFHTQDVYKYAILLNPDILPDLAKMLKKLDSHKNFVAELTKPSDHLKYALASLFAPWHRVGDPNRTTTLLPDQHLRELQVLSKVPEYYAKGFFNDPAFSDFLIGFLYHDPEIAWKLPETDKKRSELFAQALAARLHVGRDVDEAIELFRKHKDKMDPEHHAMVVIGAFNGNPGNRYVLGKKQVPWEILLHEVKDRIGAGASRSIMLHILENGREPHVHAAFSILAKNTGGVLGAVSALVERDPDLAADVLDKHAHEIHPAEFVASVVHLGRNSDPQRARELLERHSDILPPELIDLASSELDKLKKERSDHS